ncbi:MAG: DegT/DnrJ/EryC1/StrS family aminotransferase [Mesorhizobium sp.]|uniref:DegT/DnrJ/EryC1/StrS family aminotransferase n=1 Tax=Mesorhizobium sp. TaxID=1871066 RepID=UPI000FE6C7B8|nr:DegT/DnrJ/EryC1/StrS family aminotransferase [Mesorhizobium sp.]RWO35495.1 MAG: DegT/DnrJ/EryC1/StrS family aminotransferase [Mesorhizobium sp.]RWO52442.1 MAG: DegT/DnrJ/EryC1/StrS family aminotransferase [Mesorhizobium sp.]
MLGTSFSPWPSFSAEEGNLAREILLSNRVNYWTGEEGRLFEREFAKWAGTEHAVAVANGTVAMDLAWKALDIAPGDEIVVTPRTFLASASSIVNAGAVPVFADVDRASQNITAETVEPVLTARTKAILAVHLAGWPCEMDGLRDLAAANDLYLVEDCAQAHGARYRGRPVGSLGDIAAWSFCQDKIMTTAGEGGMVTTDNADWWSRMWSYKDHGKSWDAVYGRQHVPGFRWLHESFGTNWRLPELQSAIGRFQLRKIEAWHETRTRNAEAILEAARNSAVLRVPDMPDHVEHGWYKCYVFVRPEVLKADWTRDRLIAEIVARGVPCYSGSCSEIYLEKAFDSTGWRPAERLPIARQLGETSLMFLVHPTLTGAEIEKTQSVIAELSALAMR